MHTNQTQAERRTLTNIKFAWLEVTGKCQLECDHCYAESSPSGTHGQMESSDWRRVIEQLAAAGVEMVQFIGGEPTLYPGLPQLIDHALANGLEVEVFSNLVYIRNSLWEYLSRPGVCMATSYYSDQAAEHEQITGRRGSHRRTRANIIEVLKRSIPLRVGIIGIQGGQRFEEARAELVNLGVSGDRIGLDFLRGVGRGVRGNNTPNVDQLCGNCARGVIAVSPSGEVWPCVFSRWLPVGNVLEQSVAEILAGEVIAETREELAAAFEERGLASQEDCIPDNCNPSCNPEACQPYGHVQHPDADKTFTRQLRACGPCTPTLCNPHVCNPISDPPHGDDIGTAPVPLQACGPNACNPLGGGGCVPSTCGPDVCNPDVCGPAGHHRGEELTACNPDICVPGPDCIPKACQPDCSPAGFTPIVERATPLTSCSPCQPDSGCSPRPDCTPALVLTSCTPDYACTPEQCNPDVPFSQEKSRLRPQPAEVNATRV